METTVELQDPFLYLIIWIIIALLFIGLVIFSQVFFRKKLGDRLRREKQIRIKRISEATLEGKKRKYIGELQFIETDLINKRITVRQAYLKMSLCIRMFVYEVTGIKVQKYTLSEIRAINIPYLTQLVKEYYEPEFSYESRADVKSSLMKTRQLIEGWRK